MPLPPHRQQAAIRASESDGGVLGTSQTEGQRHEAMPSVRGQAAGGQFNSIAFPQNFPFAKVSTTTCKHRLQLSTTLIQLHSARCQRCLISCSHTGSASLFLAFSQPSRSLLKPTFIRFDYGRHLCSILAALFEAAARSGASQKNPR